MNQALQTQRSDNRRSDNNGTSATLGGVRFDRPVLDRHDGTIIPTHGIDPAIFREPGVVNLSGFVYVSEGFCDRHHSDKIGKKS